MSNYPLGGRRCCQRLQKTIPSGFFRAMSDPTRLALLVQLAGCRRACTVGELAECCPVDVSVVSRHLAILRDAGLLEATRRGKEVHYRVRYDIVTDTLRAVADAVEQCCPEGCC
jgi:ArsR family transcriptional regulator